MAEVAFFGVGTMGLPMVLNLLKAGHSVHTVIHHSKEGPEEAARGSSGSCPSPPYPGQDFADNLPVFCALAVPLPGRNMPPAASCPF